MEKVLILNFPRPHAIRYAQFLFLAHTTSKLSTRKLFGLHLHTLQLQLATNQILLPPRTFNRGLKSSIAQGLTGTFY